MLHKTVDRIKRAFAIVKFGLRILRWCGLRIFLRKMLHQLYGRAVFLESTGRLDDPRPPSSFPCTISLASSDDIDELFGKLHEESLEGRYQLLVRKWYHERGIGDCYIGRADDNNEICAVRWVVTPQHIKNLGWEDRFPLAEDEIMFENLYTFEKYRREGARAACALQTRKIAQQQGFKHTRGYTDETNMPQRQWGKKSGSKVSARILERHLLFRVTRKILERFDPPIPMADLPDIE